MPVRGTGEGLTPGPSYLLIVFLKILVHLILDRLKIIFRQSLEQRMIHRHNPQFFGIVYCKIKIQNGPSYPTLTLLLQKNILMFDFEH